MIQLIYCDPFVKMHIYLFAMGHSASILRPLVSSRTKSLLSFTILIPVPLVLPTVRPPTSYRTAFKTSFKTEVVYLLMKIKKKMSCPFNVFSYNKFFRRSSPLSFGKDIIHNFSWWP